MTPEAAAGIDAAIASMCSLSALTPDPFASVSCAKLHHVVQEIAPRVHEVELALQLRDLRLQRATLGGFRCRRAAACVAAISA